MFGSVYGWVGFNYVRTIRFDLSYTCKAVLTYFITYVRQEGLHNCLG